MAQVWGFVKYYHPVVRAGRVDIDYELFKLLPSLVDCKSSHARNAILAVWISQLGRYKTHRQYDTGKVAVYPDYSWMSKESLGGALTKELKKLVKAKRDTGNYYARLYRRVVPSFNNEKFYANQSGYPDIEYRLLALFRLWNMLYYYYPYKSDVKEDWLTLLRRYIPRFVQAGTETDYKRIILSFSTKIHDSHANISSSYYYGHRQRTAPVYATFVEGEAVIAGYLDSIQAVSNNLLKGDIVEEINGRNIKSIIDYAREIIACSNEQTLFRDLSKQLLLTNNANLKLKCRRDTLVISANVRALPRDSVSKSKRIETCYRLINGIPYIYAAALTEETFDAIWKAASKYKGIIIDYRCYPRGGYIWLWARKLLNKPTYFALATEANVLTPGEFLWRTTQQIGWTKGDGYTGKVMVLVSEQTQSAAEYQVMSLQASPNVTVVGSPTAGADGNAAIYYLPGGVQGMFSGLGIFYPDKAPTQQVGIRIDVVVKPSIQSIKEGRDEILEKAIEILNNE